MRVLLTGSQLWTDKVLIFEELDWLLEEVAHNENEEYIFVLVHGHCPNGADAHADEWGRLRKSQGFPIIIERHPADWKGPKKRGAGYARNAEMVALGADRGLAFILDNSSGSTHCKDLAEKAGIPMQIFRSETSMAQIESKLDPRRGYKRVNEEIKLEGVRLMWRNFAGEKKLYNENGKRVFAIPLEEDIAVELYNIGWNVKDNVAKVNDPTNAADEVRYHLDVTVKMDGKVQPRLFLVGKKWSARENMEISVRTLLDEDTLPLLDYAPLEYTDLILRPFNWDVSGKKGVTAYLKTLFAFLKRDDLEAKYAHIPIEGPDLPELEGSEDDGVLDVEGSEWVEDEQPALPSGRS